MKRTVYLIHRWTGIGMCLLMAIWFLSGVVMLFVGYPKLTPWERLAALPALPPDACCIAPEQALASAAKPGALKSLTLSSVAGKPAYILQAADGAMRAIDAANGRPIAAREQQLALASANAYAGGAAAAYGGTVTEDRWTHSRLLNPHRPLHVVELRDTAHTRVYVSSATGQVVLDVPRAERYWNFVGAWLHWIYLLKNQPTDPVWTWTLIVLSALAVLSATTGIVNGIWRWRFVGRYKNGTCTPYREAYMRWHHMLGLVFGALLFTWVLSGLMSMNPIGMFDAKGMRPDTVAMQDGNPVAIRLPQASTALLAALAQHGFIANELEWKVLGGQPYVLARDMTNATRLLMAAGSGVAVLDQLPADQLLAAARKLFPYPVATVEILTSYDVQYYRRGEASMYGGNERRLPALRIRYADPHGTWVHLDMHTGHVELSVDRAQRAGRWLFNLLHSWDLPSLLDLNWLRDAAIICASLGGLLLSVTACVIAVRRLAVRSSHAKR